MAAAVEQFSEHPLAKAVLAEANRRGVSLKPTTEFQSIPGIGVSGQVEGKRVVVGIEKRDSNGTSGSQTKHSSQTSATISVGDQVIGAIEFNDAVRESAVTTIRELKQLSVRSGILSGDRSAAARQLGVQLGIAADDVHAGLMPDEKLQIGISLGTGTDIAKTVAAVILVHPDLQRIVKAIKLSRTVSTNIRQNLVFAFAYNVIGIPVAAGVLYPLWGMTLNPMIGAAAMSLSSVSVIVNALRLQTERLK
jgi:Cu+-exporting ATPase